MTFDGDGADSACSLQHDARLRRALRKTSSLRRDRVAANEGAARCVLLVEHVVRQRRDQRFAVANTSVECTLNRIGTYDAYASRCACPNMLPLNSRTLGDTSR